MFEFANVHRVPRARVDRIESHFDALRIVTISMATPAAHQIIAITLDAEQRGIHVLAINETTEPDALLGVVDMIVDSAAYDAEVHGLVLAAIRPGGDVDFADLGRWNEIDDLCASAGIDLIEWFVLGATISCPRDMCGTAPRWAA